MRAERYQLEDLTLDPELQPREAIDRDLLPYAAWLTSIVFCAANGTRPLLFVSAAFFPVGIVHGIGVWFCGW